MVICRLCVEVLFKTIMVSECHVVFEVSLNSSADIIVCNCRHLSVFSADNLIQPNKLDPFKMSFFLSVFYNPIVFVLVIAVWCIYALLMVWARRKDSEDLMKVMPLCKMCQIELLKQK